MVKRSLGVLGLAAFLQFAWADEPASTVVVAPTPVSEEAVKAAFLFNFTKFIEWPQEAVNKNGDTFGICIWGEDPFGTELENQFNGQIVHGKKLKFIRLSRAQRATECQVAYISASESGSLASFFESLGDPQVLTVSDMDRFIHRGGMVGFITEENRVRFNVNLTEAEKAGLKISSQLLKLAKVVRGKPALATN